MEIDEEKVDGIALARLRLTLGAGVGASCYGGFRGGARPSQGRPLAVCRERLARGALKLRRGAW